MSDLKLLSVSDLCELLGLHAHTIRKMFKNGELPGFYVGPKLIRFRADEIMLYMVRASNKYHKEHDDGEYYRSHQYNENPAHKDDPNVKI